MITRFEEDIGLIKKVIVESREGRRSNLALIFDPFYGESELMDRIEGMTGEDGIRINARSLIKNFDPLDEASGRIAIVEEVHHLYCRKIGGFETMNRFLKMVASSDRLFITSWNSYSWKYLDEVLGLGRYFPQKILLPKMGADDIKGMLLSGYEVGELTFIEKEIAKEKTRILSWSSYKRSLIGRNLEIPLPVIDVESIRSRLSKTEKKSSEEIFFDKLTRISDGNPGVAKLLWTVALDYPEVRNNLKDPSQIDLNYDESFALSIVLSMKSVEVGYLSEVLEPLDLDAENITSLLEERELVEVDNGVVTVRAESLKSIVEHLRRLRLVW